MDGSLVAVLKVLDVFFDMSRGVDRKDVAVAGIVIERIAVYGVRRLLSGKEEDGACLCVGIICFGYGPSQYWLRVSMSYYSRCPPMGKLPVCTISLGLFTSCELHFFIEAP
jgi:hypothetical protein